MRNRLTFPEVIQVLLEYKNKTYTQNQLIRDLFSSCLKTSASNADEAVEDNIKFSRWVKGERPIPQDILDKYQEPNGIKDMECDIEDLIIPNLINVSGAREKIIGLVKDSIDVIGQEKVNELTSKSDDAAFFTSIVRYAIYNSHDNASLLSPMLTETLLSNRLPSVADGFVGRKQEEKICSRKLNDQKILFVGGIAGIGKSEFAKYFADKNRKKYTNIIYIYYSGNLKQDITNMVFSNDRSDMTSEELFNAHYKTLQELYEDSLIILDNFNVLPKEEPFFKEFRSNRFHLLVTTRCNLKLADERKEEILTLNLEKELVPLFISNCPSAKEEKENVKEIINTVHSHTLTVILASLTLAESGLEPADLLYELKTNGLDTPDAESVDIYKDGEYAEGIMIEHLKTLLSINKLTAEEALIMRCMALLPSSGVLKQHFKEWMKLDNLEPVIRLVKHGLIQDDTENRMFNLHPLIRDVVISTMEPSISNCRLIMDSLHLVSLVHGMEYSRPINAINCQLSVMENIIIDDIPAYLMYLQDLFPHLEKYRYTEELSKLVDRIEKIMMDGKIDTPCDRALLFDYKAQLFIEKKDYDNAIKRQSKAISIMEKLKTPDATMREMSLLSNIYCNISSTYLYKKKLDIATDYLKKAFELRKEYEHLGLMESHDLLVQMMNLVELSIYAKDYTNAREILDFYENIITEYLGKETFDYARCQLMHGVIDLQTRKYKESEKHLDTAEEMIARIMGNDSKYLREVYAIKSKLHRQLGKIDLAAEYANKYREIAKNHP